MPLPSIIAIDGPVASGKTSVGKRLADKLGYLFFDTGVMYRAVTYLALRQLGSVDDAAAVAEVAEHSQIDVQTAEVADGRDYTVVAGSQGEDITWAIRSPEVEAQVSPVSAVPAVRHWLTEQMRYIGRKGRLVMVGRDIGTVVLPEADLKIFLTASVEVRAQRRYKEIRARGETRDYESILANVRDRDRIDSSRAVAPLSAAEDAITLDTTNLDLPAVVEAIESLIELPRPARGDKR
jgi:cytidylate kinase